MPMTVNTLAALSALTLTSCFSLPTSQEAGVSYATVVSPWPTTTTCLNSPTPTGIAKEVLIGSARTVVIAGGDHPISDADWTNFNPGLGNKKTSDRHLLFTRSCFARSPSKSATCRGMECREIVDLKGHTWIGLSKIEAVDCLPNNDACSGTGAKPGGLLVVVTRKCHELVFEGQVRILHGPKGERAVMHATADGHPTTNVQLPTGWTLVEEMLTEPLVLHPYGGGDACFYNIIRDELQQSYHQIGFTGAKYP